ncbi:unnamed protein product [Arabidopsis thaliana]|uniref:Transmembrane protein n=1 Tax=Arabidopsis thaliana TaxID=3702 RepID=A0A654G546_ARATH|nr:unnamed protein product [Arabidopsis thaliana]
MKPFQTLPINVPHPASVSDWFSKPIEEDKLRHCALPFSHSFLASPWTHPFSDLVPCVGKAVNPWNLTPYPNHDQSLSSSILHSSEKIHVLQISSPFSDGCRNQSLRGLHVKEVSTLTVWLTIYLMRTLVLATFRALWYLCRDLKIVALFQLNRSCCCVFCGIGLSFFNAHLPLSRSYIVFKHRTLIIISIFQTNCLTVFAAFDRRDPHLLWILKPPSPDYSTIVSRIIGIVLLWVMQLAPARIISLIRLSTSLCLSTVTNLSFFEPFEDDLSIYRDLSCCNALLCPCLNAFMDFKSLNTIYLSLFRETRLLRRELGPAGIEIEILVSSVFRSGRYFVGSFLTSRANVSPERFNS